MGRKSVSGGWASWAVLLAAVMCVLLVSASLAAGERRARRKHKQAHGPSSSAFEEELQAGMGELKVEVTQRPETCERKSREGDTVDVHYVGQLEDGQTFDSSIARQQPITLTLGQGQVIPGWEQGLLGMCPNEVRRLTIPPHLAYGDQGYPPVIPPRATLTFIVQLVGFH